jgi:hypothetical protein
MSRAFGDCEIHADISGAIDNEAESEDDGVTRPFEDFCIGVS